MLWYVVEAQAANLSAKVETAFMFLDIPSLAPWVTAAAERSLTNEPGCPKRSSPQPHDLETGIWRIIRVLIRAFGAIHAIQSLECRHDRLCERQGIVFDSASFDVSFDPASLHDARLSLRHCAYDNRCVVLLYVSRASVRCTQ